MIPRLLLLVGCLAIAARATTAVLSQAPWPRHVIDDSSRGADGIRLADVNGDGLPDVTTGWEEGGAVRAYLNPGPAKAKEKWPAVTVGHVADVEDAVFVDLDGDGAMDVVSSCEGKTRSMFIHWAPNERGRYLDEKAWRTEPLPASAQVMRWMFCLPLQIDGKHGVDLVAGGKDKDAALGWFAAPAQARRLADWKWHPLRVCGWLMSLVARDMDGDGDVDIVFTDRKGTHTGAAWLENPGPGAAPTKLWTEHVIGGAGREVMFLELADLDRDGLEDVLVGAKPREILWLRRLDRSGRAWEPHSIQQPANSGTAKAVNVADFDGDGKLDLVFSCEGAKPPLQGLMWLSCEGPFATGKWIPHLLSGPDGIKHDLIGIVDLSGDGHPDVITTEESAGANRKGLGVIWYENTSPW
ncbi:MAG: VCBS repeat-containing protein [Planctomycetes bacterium]|nr:VCBS repeat-containing protein [Planctomycetota bacterium]